MKSLVFILYTTTKGTSKRQIHPGQSATSKPPMTQHLQAKIQMPHFRILDPVRSGS